jgi:hypothetical protein
MMPPPDTIGRLPGAREFRSVRAHASHRRFVMNVGASS